MIGSLWQGRCCGRWKGEAVPSRASSLLRRQIVGWAKHSVPNKPSRCWARCALPNLRAVVENKDIGFVHAGQVAEVKVETFNFTKYGTLRGTVTQVSGDAIQDEKRGLVYAARVKLDRTTLNVDGKIVNLSPGMAVTVEIKTGKRRVIEYFLSPLIQYGEESLRER
ncbi:MAG: HlyD family secretion protein [Pseudomonadota bacterium]|nr:HlyD family secretion protein [Pseudomonadota bacterium]